MSTRQTSHSTGVANIIERLRDELARYSDRKYRINAQQFSKERLDNPWVLRTSIVRRISTQMFREIRDLSKLDIFKVCDELLESDLSESRFFAFEWALKCERDFARTDFGRFERWLRAYVHGWGACDHLCCGPFGQLLCRYPDLAPKAEKWTASRNRWLRRGSAVVLIYSVRRRKLLSAVFRTADLLLVDEDDMVQKGYGWMLKEASNEFPEEVFRYVMKHRQQMPRTALRYAIEKYPQAKRREAMKKD